MTSSYKLLQPVLANIDPEFAHQQTIALLKGVSNKPHRIAAVSKLYQNRVPDLPIQLFGKTLRNPVGLAAGFDKDGAAYPGLSALGFGFIEIGTVTPKPQPGNPKLRIFRLQKEQSIINRLGFNSGGIEMMLNNLRRYPAVSANTLLGINIGKNATTPIERAHEDYATCLEAVYQYADYVVLNLSSPNSPGLRLLQHHGEFSQLLDFIMQKRADLVTKHAGKVVPIAVKVSPDLNTDDIVPIAENALKHQVDALVATNTTVAREDGISHKHYSETGGLSGRLLTDRATSVIGQLAQATGGQIPIIGVGGVSSAQDAWDKLLAGASAVQLYTAMVFQGPTIVKNMVSGLTALAKPYDHVDFGTAIKQARQAR